MRGLSSTSIRPGGASVFLCSVWPRGRAGRGLEREGLWAGLCSPSPNDRANCTQYKSLWPINTTSTHIKSAHMHMYLYTHTKSLIECIHLCRHADLKSVNLTIHIHTHLTETQTGDSYLSYLLSYPTGPIRQAAWMMECLYFQPSFLFAVFLQHNIYCRFSTARYCSTPLNSTCSFWFSISKTRGKYLVPGTFYHLGWCSEQTEGGVQTLKTNVWS